MLGERSAQWGLCEADTLFGDFVGKRTLYGFLASQRGELFRDEDFRRAVLPKQRTAQCAAQLVGHRAGVANVRRSSMTRPNSALTTTCVLVALDRTDVRLFANITFQESGPADRARPHAVFQRTLEVPAARGVGRPAPHERQQMAGATRRTSWDGAVKAPHNPLADGIVQVLGALAKLGPCEPGSTKRLAARYAGPSLKGQADGLGNPRARQRFG